jgi:formamidopyrimidine-DNA glycosylase
MPEAPELEVVKDFLSDNVVGVKIDVASVLKPSVLRSLCGDLTADIAGREIQSAARHGKFILLGIEGERLLSINPMLTGALQYCAPNQRVYKRTCLRFSLSNGKELRYIDDKQMGMVYYVDEGQATGIPRLHEQGPDVLDEFTFEEFKDKLNHFNGEIKGVLTRGRVISGIGNAWSDEILFAAQIYPFKRRKALSDDELHRLYKQSRQVVVDAIPTVRTSIGNDIHLKARDFFQVHNRGGEPCPRCGNAISQITANKRITSYCRRCQPGMLFKN